MVKRLLTCLLAFSLVFALCACGASPEALSTDEPVEAAPDPAEETPEPVIESKPTYEVTYTSCKVVPEEKAANVCAYVQVIFAVKNTSDEAITFTNGYYDIADQNGTVIDSPTAYNPPYYLAPGETSYISYITPTNEPSYLSAESLKATPTFSIDKAFFTPVQLDITNCEYSFEADSAYTKHGLNVPQHGRGFVFNLDVNNSTGTRVSNAFVYVTIFHDGTPIGVLDSYDSNIPANGTANFEICASHDLGRFITEEDMTSYEVSIIAMP